jgi:tetratricopeptide (TPR) repeat protein
MIPALIRVPAWLLCALLALAPASAGAQPPASAAIAPETAARLNALAARLFGNRETGREVIADIQKLLADDPSLAEAHFLLGAAYTLNGSTALLGEAKAEFQQALELKPSLLQARIYLAETYIQLGRGTEASEQLDIGLKQAPDHPRLLTLLADMERQAGHPEKALELADQILKRDPSADQARYYRALALLDLRRPQDAVVDLERVAAGSSPQADVYSTLAQLYLQEHQPAKALAPLRRGIELVPDAAVLHLLLARVYRLTGSLDEADAELALAEPSRSGAEASGLYQQQQADLLAERGLLRLAQQRLPDAEQALRQAIALQPEHGPAEHGLALVLLRQRQFAEASRHARRAAALGEPLPAADLAAIRAGVAGKGR